MSSSSYSVIHKIARSAVQNILFAIEKLDNLSM